MVEIVPLAIRIVGPSTLPHTAAVNDLHASAAAFDGQRQRYRLTFAPRKTCHVVTIWAAGPRDDPRADADQPTALAMPAIPGHAAIDPVRDRPRCRRSVGRQAALGIVDLGRDLRCHIGRANGEAVNPA